MMLHLAQTRDSVRVVGDQVGSPTYTPDLAKAVWDLVTKAEGGLYQLANSGEVSFADYAREVFKMAGVTCNVDAVSSDDYAAPARRPLHSTISGERAYAAGVTPLRHWRDALAEFLQHNSVNG